MTESAIGPRWDFNTTPDERRAEIIRTLAGVLRDRKISSLTMQDVADRLGMTKGNLYHYFSSKQDLLYQCHMKGMADSLRLLDDARQATGPAGQRLKRLMQGLVQSVTNDPYGSVLITTLESLSEDQRKTYISYRNQFERGLQDLIQEGAETGEFNDLDPKITSFALLGAINWIARWYRADGDRSADYISDVFTNLLFRGLEARS